MTKQKKPVILCILDGWGDEKNTEYNAVKLANTPNFDSLLEQSPHCHLSACGKDVGLPDGQVGNSEVGHMNIGAGRVVMQNLPRIDSAIETNDFTKQKAYMDFAQKLKQSRGTAHLLCLLSDGGVHSHINHLIAYANALIADGVCVNIHAFTDGRDTAPKSALKYLEILENATTAPVATITGRYWAMDRDQNWDRIQKAYSAITFGESPNKAKTSAEAIHSAYGSGITDEFIPATVIHKYDGIYPNDGIFYVNFRTDRAREILSALADKNFTEFQRPTPVFDIALGMVEYSKHHSTFVEAIFPPLNMNNTLGEVVSRAGLSQVRTAETEKYPHVTFFFNGGEESTFPNEKRLLTSSPKVSTFDMKPEMSAYEVTQTLLLHLQENPTDMVILNFANPDMVGHTGNLKAAISACEVVDECLGKIWHYAQSSDTVLMVTADHGNCDVMYNVATGEPHTAHTLNPVQCIINGFGDVDLNDGKLGDIAPTILHILKLEQPTEMTGRNLIKC